MFDALIQQGDQQASERRRVAAPPAIPRPNPTANPIKKRAKPSAAKPKKRKRSDSESGSSSDKAFIASSDDEEPTPRKRDVGYISTALPTFDVATGGPILPTGDSLDEADSGQMMMEFVIGDAAQPAEHLKHDVGEEQVTDGGAVILHCVDASGRWGR